ncbi:hypothetical protein NKH54_32250 [Mesorhizobium sp. M1004]|uniref:hypothetical protein n=1 Tax=Mesorhizobium sp. M1004 TaxID=2957046 RepID=UPI00333AF03F
MNEQRATIEIPSQVAPSSLQAKRDRDAGRNFSRVAEGRIRISLCQPEPVLQEAALRLRRFASSYRREAA